MMKLCFVFPKRKIHKIFLKAKGSDSNSNRNVKNDLDIKCYSPK